MIKKNMKDNAQISIGGPKNFIAKNKIRIITKNLGLALVVVENLKKPYMKKQKKNCDMEYSTR